MRRLACQRARAALPRALACRIGMVSFGDPGLWRVRCLPVFVFAAMIGPLPAAGVGGLIGDPVLEASSVQKKFGLLHASVAPLKRVSWNVRRSKHFVGKAAPSIRTFPLMQGPEGGFRSATPNGAHA